MTRPVSSENEPTVSAPVAMCFSCKCGAKFHPRTTHSRQVSEQFDEQRFVCPKCGSKYARMRERETVFIPGENPVQIRGRKVIYKLKK